MGGGVGGGVEVGIKAGRMEGLKVKGKVDWGVADSWRVPGRTE